MERLYLNFELTEEEFVELNSVATEDPLYLALATGALTSVIMVVLCFLIRPAWLFPAFPVLILTTVSLTVLVLGKMSFFHKERESEVRNSFRCAGLEGQVRCYLFERDSWTEIFDGHATKLTWSQIGLWFESENLFILKLSRSKVPIPKRCLDNPSKLRQLLQQNVGPRRDFF